MRPRLVLCVVLLLAAAAAAEETTSSWEKWTRERAQTERQGHFEDAIEEWIAVSRLRPADVRSLSRAAVVAVEADQIRGKELTSGSSFFAIADHCVQEAVPRWGQTDPGLTYVIGRLRVAEQKWGASWRMLRQSKEMGFDPLLSRYWYYRASVNRSVMLVDQQRFQEAKDSLSELRRTMPEHPDRRFLEIDLAAAHRGMDEPEEAMKLLRGVLDRDPDVADAHYQWALILTAQGHLDEAVSRLREAMRYASAGSNRGTYRNALLKLGDVELKRLKFDEADAAANQALELDRDDPEAIFLKARVLMEKGKPDLDAALPMLRRAARLRPDTLETLTRLMQVLSQLGETKEAEEVQKKIDEFKKKRELTLEGK